MELVNEIYVSEVKDLKDELSRRVTREAIETVVLRHLFPTLQRSSGRL
jgi:hypothetical protein